MTASPSPAPRIAQLARSAVRALYAEVALEPKPGLVSLRDSGSHTDMTAATFLHSLFALRHYFGHIAQAGFEGADFGHLQALGLAAEARMLRATGGVNTHRGAVFSLGLLCAAGGRLAAQGTTFTPLALRQALCERWGDALRAHALASAQAQARSNGQKAARRFHLRSAADEAALGFPHLFEVTLPALLGAVQRGHGLRAARVQAFFATLAVLDDTNVAHRGGWQGLQFVRQSAANFLQAGGVDQPDWVPLARRIHGEFVARRLSPGGAADLLACACWTHALLPQHGAAARPAPAARVPLQAWA